MTFIECHTTVNQVIFIRTDQITVIKQAEFEQGSLIILTFGVHYSVIESPREIIEVLNNTHYFE